MRKRFDLFELFENKRFLMVFAFLISMLLFIFVSMSGNENIDYTITNVPVNLDLQSANLTNLRLNIIEGDNNYVDVKINVPRTQLAQYSADSPELATTAQVSSITEPGVHTLSVMSAVANVEDLPFTIVSYSPRTIQVRVDRLKSSTFDINPVVKGLSVAKGYVLDSETVSPSTVTVSGPESEISKISSVEVSLDLPEPLAQTYAPMLPIVLKDAEGKEIDPDTHHIKMDATEVQLALTVLKETGVPLEVGFQNIPRDFPTEKLKEAMTITPDYVRIAGREEVVDRLTEILLGYVDIKELRPGSNSFTFPLRLGDISDEITSLENITNVSVMFDDFNWDTQTFNLSNLQLINQPSGYDVRLMSERLDNVTLVGDKDVLEALTADDIVAEVDLFDRELSTGQRSFPVKISVPGKGLVWALGSYTTVIQVEEKE